jgi:hypothetical protein
LSVSLSVCLSVCLSLWISFAILTVCNLFVWLPSASLFASLTFFLPTCLRSCLTLYLPTCQPASIYLQACLPTYACIILSV